jgi:hypothetical protein
MLHLLQRSVSLVVQVEQLEAFAHVLIPATCVHQLCSHATERELVDCDQVGGSPRR